ncbi:putative transport protein [Lysobacter niastensis]|uniref:Transport protein n=1 Tax=Lysobacter niastensis TaxID=380629 RepID=A0ABU1WCF1_9GAMM|nr:TrkA C-terminal domain-containing protein [Lysobacter niastensis]MDR7135273.1 putative transport protein [Lysobacter niastensis]
MQAFFQFLADNPYILLFFTVGMAVWVGKFAVKGYGLGMVAAAVVVGAALATWASTYGVKLQLDNFAKSLFYYLFMYGVGLRVGPAFFNSLKKDGITFTILAVVCAFLGLGLVVLMSKILELPAGAAGGVLAGSQTMSAAIGTAEMAVEQGAYKLPAGTTAEQVTAMIALGYGVTYIWGTVGIILICKYLPRWWGIDAKAAAAQYEAEHGVKNVDDAAVTGYRAGGLRAYRLDNAAVAGKSIHDFRQGYPQYRIVNVVRGDEALGASPDLVLQKGDVIALGGHLEELTANLGLIGAEVPDAKVLNIPLDQAEILVTEKEADGKVLKSFAKEDFAGHLQITRIERMGEPIPLGTETELKRWDVMYVAGLKGTIDKVAAKLGRIARPSTSTDLLTLSAGMVLGLLIGKITVPVGDFSVGLGNAGGLLLSGILVSSLVSRLRFFGSTPNAARNILEDLGLVTFIAIVGINAGATLLEQLTGAIAVKIFVAGFVASTIPPFITWAIGLYVFKINPAVLMGGVAGSRSHSGPAREAAKETGTSVPWVGFPVGYAVSGVLYTVFGYFAMLLSQ